MNFIARRCSPVILGCAVVLVVTGCGGGPTETSPVTPTPQAMDPTTAAPTPQPSELRVLLASSDLSVGPNRLGFGLVDSQSGAVRDKVVQVSTYYLGASTPQGPIETAKAVFRKWPVGVGGVYTARLSFDRSGTWALTATVAEPDGSSRTGSVAIEVKESSATPAVGSAAPRSANKTSRDVASLGELTTDPDPDPDLYSLTIADALDAGWPLMVVFATPAYCQTATCGPQVEVVRDLKDRYKTEVTFIHVEVYDNLQEIEGDLTRARISPTVSEWNLPSEPWTFIVDSQGRINSKFEGFTTGEELEDALGQVLR